MTSRPISTPRVVWTLFNAQFRTYRGACLRVPHRPGTRYTDAFAAAPIQPHIQDGQATLSVTLGPRGVGCVVASSTNESRH